MRRTESALFRGTAGGQEEPDGASSSEQVHERDLTPPCGDRVARGRSRNCLELFVTSSCGNGRLRERLHAPERVTRMTFAAAPRLQAVLSAGWGGRARADSRAFSGGRSRCGGAKNRQGCRGKTTGRGSKGEGAPSHPKDSNTTSVRSPRPERFEPAVCSFAGARCALRCRKGGGAKSTSWHASHDVKDASACSNPVRGRGRLQPTRRACGVRSIEGRDRPCSSRAVLGREAEVIARQDVRPVHQGWKETHHMKSRIGTFAIVVLTVALATA